MDTKELQQKQEEYDSKYWKHEPGDLEKIRHITLHMGKLLGKLSTYCEAQEHGSDHSTKVIEEQVIPDLLFYSLQLSNLLGRDLGESYIKRLKSNAQNY